jgi:hypothetical protein
MMNAMRTSMLVVAVITCWTAPAFAEDVFLNGVRITGVKNQNFDNATVKIDSQGNVRILAPQYKVERLDTTHRGTAGTTKISTKSAPSTPRPPTIAPQRPTTKTASPPPAGGGSGLSRRYWLVAEVSTPGMVQYRIEVRINGRLVRSFTDAEVPTPVEVTEYLRPGRNAVRVTAEKITEGGRRSESSRHWLRVVVADGHIEGTAVVIDRPGVIFTRNAAQTDRASREFNLNAQ